jgi:diacylglycerol kinase (ATP)
MEKAIPDKLRIKFIVNPISGGKEKSVVEKKIIDYFSPEYYDIDIEYTRHKNHANAIARSAVLENFKIVVAVGGDGTVNETAKALIGTSLQFGIIPMGSGNGLARFLKIPMHPEKAIKVIKKRKIFLMDTININDEHFVNIAGLGFDALIGHLFANYGKRGLMSYIRLIFREFFKYRNEEYELIIDGRIHKIEALLISFANSSQFGNEAHIAPLAEINDGLIDICVLKKFPWWKSIFLAILLYSKGLTKSKYYQVIKTKSAEIKNTKSLLAHIDGDPIIFNSDISININPLSLKILIP